MLNQRTAHKQSKLDHFSIQVKAELETRVARICLASSKWTVADKLRLFQLQHGLADCIISSAAWSRIEYPCAPCQLSWSSSISVQPCKGVW